MPTCWSRSQNGFGSGPIKVMSEDGKKWTKILGGDLTLPVKIYLGITSGYLTSYEIKQVATTILQGQPPSRLRKSWPES
jgi:hypothetical protein